MRSRVPFEIERIVESFAAEGAQVSFELTVILQVPVEQSLKFERFRAQTADEIFAMID